MVLVRGIWILRGEFEGAYSVLRYCTALASKQNTVTPVP